MSKQPRKTQHIPDPIEIRIPDRKYQPSKSELGAEIDMPGLSIKKAKAAFFRPFRFVHDPD